MSWDWSWAVQGSSADGLLLRLLVAVGRFGFSFLEVSDHDWEHGKDYDGKDDVGEVPFYGWDIAEEKAREREGKDPGGSAGDIIEGEAAIAHFPDASDEGDESADNGNEAGEEDGLSAVFIVEELGFLEVFGIEEPGLAFGKDARTDPITDPIVCGIAEDGGDGEESEAKIEAQRAGGTDGADGEEERITWEEGSDDQSGFAEDDQE